MMLPEVYWTTEIEPRLLAFGARPRTGEWLQALDLDYCGTRGTGAFRNVESRLWIARSMAIMLFALPCLGGARDLQLDFRAASPEFETAAREYGRIWHEDGARIVEALERAMGVELPERRIDVVVVEARSHSGSSSTPMRLRASYPETVKRGTIVHELAHRYLAQLGSTKSELSEHQALYLVLPNVWRELWGDAFASRQIGVESGWSPDYRRDWAWVLSLPDSERKARWETIVRSPRGDVGQTLDP